MRLSKRLETIVKQAALVCGGEAVSYTHLDVYKRQQEYRLLGIQQGLDRGILKGLALSAAEAAFLPEEEKEKLKAVIEREFYSWLEDKWEK